MKKREVKTSDQRYLEKGECWRVISKLTISTSAEMTKIGEYFGIWITYIGLFGLDESYMLCLVLIMLVIK